MSPTLTTPLAQYEHVRHAGPLVYLAGQGHRDPLNDTYVGLSFGPDGRITHSDTTAQAAGCLANVERALASVGLERSALIDVMVFLLDMADFEAMNRAWNEFFVGLKPPTRTTIGVAALPGANRIEMKAVALAPERQEARMR